MGITTDMREHEGKRSIRVLMTADDKREFKTRCAEYDTTESEVMRKAIRDFMTTHLPKRKYDGVV
jgi:hypothetical protein